MKNDKYILWGSFLVLALTVILFIALPPLQKTEPKEVVTLATTTQSSGTVAENSSSTIMASGTPQIPDTRFNTTLWSATYRNDVYGFTLVFPDSWSSYRAKDVDGGVQFGVEDQDNVFTIYASTKKEWEEKINESKKPGASAPHSVIKKSDTYVFSVERANDFSEKVMPLISVYPSILTTFSFIKK